MIPSKSQYIADHLKNSIQEVEDVFSQKNVKRIFVKHLAPKQDNDKNHFISQLINNCPMSPLGRKRTFIPD